MHHLPTDDPEEEADRFASEFLMPATEIGPELSNLTLQRAVELKGYWKVSMQSIVVHAHRLGKISEFDYQKLFRQIYAKKYHRCEPLPIAVEEPTMFAELLRLQCTAFNRSPKNAGEYIGELEDAFRADYWNTIGGLRLAL